MRSQLDLCRSQLSTLAQEKEGQARETEQLRDELGVLTRENQAVHSELQRALGERATLSAKVEDYTQSMLRVQETVASKEQENSELLQSYRSVSQAMEQLQVSSHSSLGEMAVVRAELATLGQVKRQLEEVVEQQGKEIQQHLDSLAAMEQQFSSLTHAMARMEATLRQEGEEKAALVADLTATRELCVQLDKTKESLMRQLASQNMGMEQTQVSCAVSLHPVSGLPA